MGYIDMHCDTLMQFCINAPRNNLYKNDLQVDFLKLKSGNSLAQFFAIFMVSEEFYKHRNLPPISEKEYFDRLYKGFISEIEISLCMIYSFICS